MAEDTKKKAVATFNKKLSLTYDSKQAENKINYIKDLETVIDEYPKDKQGSVLKLNGLESKYGNNRFVKGMKEIESTVDKAKADNLYKSVQKDIKAVSWLARGGPQDEYESIKGANLPLGQDSPGNIDETNRVRTEVIDFVVNEIKSGNYVEKDTSSIVPQFKPVDKTVLDDGTELETNKNQTYADRVKHWDAHFKFNDAERLALSQKRLDAVAYRITNYPTGLMGNDVWVPWVQSDDFEVGKVGGYIDIESMAENGFKIPMPFGGYLSFDDFDKVTREEDGSEKLFLSMGSKDAQIYAKGKDVPVSIVYNSHYKTKPNISDTELSKLSANITDGKKTVWNNTLFDIYNNNFPEIFNEKDNELFNNWFSYNGGHEKIFSFTPQDGESVAEFTEQYGLSSSGASSDDSFFGSIDIDYNAEWIRNNPNEWKKFVAGMYKQVSNISDNNPIKSKIINWIKAGTPFTAISPTNSKHQPFKLTEHYDESFLTVGQQGISALASDDPAEREKALRSAFGNDWKSYSSETTTLGNIESKVRSLQEVIKQKGASGLLESFTIEEVDNLTNQLYQANEMNKVSDALQLVESEVKKNTLMRTQPIDPNLSVSSDSKIQDALNPDNLSNYDRIFDDEVTENAFQEWKKALIYPELMDEEGSFPEEANIFTISRRAGTNGGKNSRYVARLNDMLMNDMIDEDDYNSLMKVGKAMDSHLDDYFNHYFFTKHYHDVHNLGPGLKNDLDYFIEMPVADYFNLGNPLENFANMSDSEFKNLVSGTIFEGDTFSNTLRGGAAFANGMYQGLKPFTSPLALAQVAPIGKAMQAFKTIKYGALAYFSYETGAHATSSGSDAFTAFVNGDRRLGATLLGESFTHSLLTGVMAKHFVGTKGKWNPKTMQYDKPSGLIGEAQRFNKDILAESVDRAWFDYQRESMFDLAFFEKAKMKIFTESNKLTKAEASEKYGVDFGVKDNITGYLAELYNGSNKFNYKSPIDMTPEEYAFAVKKMENFVVDILAKDLKGKNFDLHKFSEWWDKDYNYIREFALVEFPQLVDNPNLFKMYDFLFSIQSQGANLNNNLAGANFMFRHFLEFGELPTKKTSGVNIDRYGLTEIQINKYNNFLSKFKDKEGKINFNEAMNFLELEMPIGDLQAFAKEMGVTLDTKLGNVKNQSRAYGAQLFGPKIGNMHLAFQGIQKFPVDLWMMNMYQVATGNIRYDGGKIAESPYNWKEIKLIEDAVAGASQRLGLTPNKTQAASWVALREKYFNLGQKEQPANYYNPAIERLNSYTDFKSQSKGTDYDFANMEVLALGDKPFMRFMINEKPSDKKIRLENTSTRQLANYGIRLVKDYVDKVSIETAKSGVASFPGPIIEFVKNSQMFRPKKGIKIADREIADLKAEIGNVGMVMYKRFLYGMKGKPKTQAKDTFKSYILSEFGVNSRQFNQPPSKRNQASKMAHEILDNYESYVSAVDAIKGPNWKPSESDTFLSGNKPNMAITDNYYNLLTDTVLKQLLLDPNAKQTRTWAKAEATGYNITNMKNMFDEILSFNYKNPRKRLLDDTEQLSVSRLLEIFLPRLKEMGDLNNKGKLDAKGIKEYKYVQDFVTNALQMEQISSAGTGQALNIRKKIKEDRAMMGKKLGKDYQEMLGLLQDQGLPWDKKANLLDRMIEMNRSFLLTQAGSIVNSVAGNLVGNASRYMTGVIAPAVDYVMVDLGLGDFARKTLYEKKSLNNYKYYANKYGMKLPKGFNKSPDVRTAHFRDILLYAKGQSHGLPMAIKNTYYALTEQPEKFGGFADRTTHEGIRSVAFSPYALNRKGKYRRFYSDIPLVGGEKIPTGKMIRVGTNVQNALDMFFKETTAMGELYVIADKIAVNELGYKRYGPSYKKLMNQLSSKTTNSWFSRTVNWPSVGAGKKLDAKMNIIDRSAGQSVLEGSYKNKLGPFGSIKSLKLEPKLDLRLETTWNGREMSVGDWVMERARDITYQSNLGAMEKVISTIRQGKNILKPLNFFLPFVKTGINVGRMTVQHSPFGMLTPTLLKSFEKGIREGNFNSFSQNTSKSLAGTGLFYLTIQSLGQMPTQYDYVGGMRNMSREERNKRKSLGQMPYSIGVYNRETNKKVYMDYRGKLGWMEGMVGYAIEMEERGEKEADASYAERMVKNYDLIFSTFGKELTHNALFDGFIDAGNTLKSITTFDNQNQGDRLARGLASTTSDIFNNTITPAVAQQLYESMKGSPVYYDKNGWGNQILKAQDKSFVPDVLTDWVASLGANKSPFDQDSAYGVTELLPEPNVLGGFTDNRSGRYVGANATLSLLGIKRTETFVGVDEVILEELLALDEGDLAFDMDNYYTDILAEQIPVVDEDGEPMFINREQLGGKYYTTDTGDFVNKDVFDRTLIEVQDRVPYAVKWWHKYILGQTFKAKMTEFMFAGEGTHVYDVNNQEYIAVKDLDNMFVGSKGVETFFSTEQIGSSEAKSLGLNQYNMVNGKPELTLRLDDNGRPMLNELYKNQKSYAKKNMIKERFAHVRKLLGKTVMNDYFGYDKELFYKDLDVDFYSDEALKDAAVEYANGLLKTGDIEPDEIQQYIMIHLKNSYQAIGKSIDNIMNPATNFMPGDEQEAIQEIQQSRESLDEQIDVQTD